MSVTFEEAQRAILGEFSKLVGDVELVPIEHAVGRTLVADIVSSEAIPSFDRASVSGYAVCAADTAFASANEPTLLYYKGDVEAGVGARFALSPGECAYVPIGGEIPSGGDAVIEADAATLTPEKRLTVTAPALENANIMPKGSDIGLGDTLVESGRILTVKDICILAALGVVFVQVYRTPRIGVLTVGSELVRAAATPQRGEARDIISYELSAAIHLFGGSPVMVGIFPNDFGELMHAFRDAASSFDVVLCSATGEANATVSAVLNELGRVVFDGLTIEPGADATLAVIGHTPVFKLPSTPFGAYICAKLFVRDMLSSMTGAAAPQESYRAVFCGRFSAPPDRDCFLPVMASVSEGVATALPIDADICSVAALLKSNGFIRVPRGSILTRNSVISVIRY